MKIIQFDCDGTHYWAASLGLGSKMANNLLAKAMSEGRCPMSLSDLSIEMMDETEQWCRNQGITAYQLDPMYNLQIWFENANDAMLFKLTYG